MNRDVQRLIDSPEYEQLFPNSRLLERISAALPEEVIFETVIF